MFICAKREGDGRLKDKINLFFFLVWGFSNARKIIFAVKEMDIVWFVNELNRTRPSFPTQHAGKFFEFLLFKAKKRLCFGNQNNIRKCDE